MLHPVQYFKEFLPVYVHLCVLLSAMWATVLIVSNFFKTFKEPKRTPAIHLRRFMYAHLLCGCLFLAVNTFIEYFNVDESWWQSIRDYITR